MMPQVDQRRGDDSDRLALVEILHEGFLDAAARAGGEIAATYAIGGSIVRLRFAGEALAPRVARALAHLRTDATEDGGSTALTLCLWDSASTGRNLPLLVKSLLRSLHYTWLEERGLRGEIRDFTSARVRAALEGYGTDILSTLDLQTGFGVWWTPDGCALPWYESGAPLRTLLTWWFGARGLQIIHGGAVGLPAGGLLLAGKGGSGKSTTALACLDSPLLYAGDDYALITMNGQPQAYSLYNTAKVKSSADFVRFPWMASQISNPDRLRAGVRADADSEKPMVFLHETQPHKLIREFPLKALVLPRYIPDAEGCRLVPVAPASAFKSIAQSSIPQLTGTGGEAMRALLQLTRAVPCYLLGLSEDVREIPDVLLNLLAGDQ